MTINRRGVLRGAAYAATAGALTSGCAPNGRPSSARASSATPTSPAASPSSASAAPVLPAQITHGPRDRPRVALTFHGQGEPAMATALLAEAERAGARLTVMAVGQWLDANPSLAHRILDGGHELGNHTQSHRDIDAMGEAAAYAEIAGCAQRLRRLTGSEGHWFRPSQTRLANALVERAARRAGYAHTLSYDVDSLDYTDPGADAVRKNVLRQVRPGSVVSLHLGHAGTIAALPAILDGLHQRGLSAVTTTELLT
ncbi:polysaccharide deacetylase family protein [Actinacidiphila oryziradicis]|jgi:peptidoglycan/xylan/chitin deacetylase (PgdA/CDA1 family)|uniref:polysaccharide deacetylase family protein n=1 Tax=Actinacidiphila oryziradicis TaxID=2571141 RepID=UPI0023EFFCBD|nr:polysaccharide deacetylase family protein [Actinacidiphila oryziradicis]MCW2869204.1 polysaccharide deacetylase [Actinacidiphila oryziradicis]